MKVLVFDTETTAIHPGQICQLSALLSDGRAVECFNWFFEVDDMTPGSQEIHGFSLDDLDALSGGECFEDAADDVAALFARADMLVAHNLDFDVRFMTAEMQRMGKKFRYRNGLCTMNYFSPLLGLKKTVQTGRPKPPKLEELIDHFALDRQEIAQQASTLFGGGDAAHDARYDVMATYDVLMAAVAAGHIRKLFE